MGEKISLNGSYFYNGTNNNTIASLKRNYYFSDESLGNLYTEDYRQEHINHNHRFRLRMEYEINARNKLIFIPKVSFQILKGTEAIFAKNQFSEQQTILETSTKSEINNDVMSISGDILYTHKFLKEGRTFSVNLSSNKNNSNNSEKLNNLTYNMELDSLVNIIDQTTDLDHRTSSRSANFIFTERLSNKFSLSFNYNPSHSLSESVNVNNLLDTNTGNYSIFDSIISNSLSTKIITHIVGSTLQFSTNKTTLSAAMSFQNQLLQGNYIFPELEPISKQCNNLMPTLMFMHRFNSSTNLRVILKSGNTLPSTNQLQEFLDNSNPLQLYIGNSELNPESYKMLLTRFSTTNVDKNRSFFAFLMFQFKNDYIGKSTYRAGYDTVIINRHTLIPYSQLTTYENLSNYYNLRSFFTYSFPIPDLKSNLNLNGSFGYNITPGKTNEIESIASNINSSIGCVLSIIISHNLDYNISYNFSRNWMTNSQLFSNNNNTHKTSISFTYSVKNRLVLSTDGQLYLYQGFENLTNENPFIVNLTLGYKFFERNNLQAQFSIYDLFKQNIDFISSTTTIYIEETKTNVLQQYFLISFIYKMNN